MDEGTQRILRWVYTGVLLVAAVGFAWRGAAPQLPASVAETALFRAVSWLGFVVSFSMAGLPWVLREG